MHFLKYWLIFCVGGILASQGQKDEQKYQPVFEKKAPYDIFIIRSQNLKAREVKPIEGVLINLL